MKNIVIIGDSYSTFEGYIPDGYAVYYSLQGLTNGNDINSVEQTWWWKFSKETNTNIILNNSFSGSTIGYTGYYGGDCRSTSFITRLDELVNNKYFEKNNIDTLIVFGGTNDSWSDAPLGKLNFDDNQNLYEVLPAIYTMVKKIKSLEKIGVKTLFIINNAVIKQEISNAIKTCCDKFEIISINVDDFDKVDGHPNSNGMTEIVNKIISKIK